MQPQSMRCDALWMFLRLCARNITVRYSSSFIRKNTIDQTLRFIATWTTATSRQSQMLTGLPSFYLPRPLARYSLNILDGVPTPEEL
jgi:hypothetical protein